MERDIQRDYRLNWPRLVEAAKARRKEMKLTQRRLAAIAGVSLPTVVSFEASGDLRLSSAEAILKVLDMSERLVEGTLRIRAGGTAGTEPFQAMFAPYAGTGGALEPHHLANLNAVQQFLDESGVDRDVQAKTIAELKMKSVAEVANLKLSTEKLRRFWPIQFVAM